MTADQLVRLIYERRSFLCIGLDPDLARLPRHLKETADPLFAFNKAIVDATRDLCVAYKPNLAFYEALGWQGWRSFERTVAYIGKSHFIIADAKRGDIGNTSRRYAAAFFEHTACDAVTVVPYMGHDSVRPFLGFEGKWVVLLGLTSNPGSADFQMRPMADGQPLYRHVVARAMQWAGPDELMFVLGATHPDELARMRALAPAHFFLVPGVGAQGGSLAAVAQAALNDRCGLLVNASRSIIYAGQGADFASKARAAAASLQQQMAALLPH